MKPLPVATAIALGLTTAALAVAGSALAAPAGPTSVDQTVSTLKASGYHVILNRTGTQPLSQCVVAAVRPGQEMTRTDSGHPSDALATTVISKTVYVDVRC